MQTIAKWGNSLAVRLPRHVAEGVRLFEGTPVSMHVEGDRLVITPARPKYKLSELLEQHKARHRHEETDWGKPRGEEAW